MTKSLTLEEFARRILRPIFIVEARRLLSGMVGVQVTTLVWFGGRYRAVPNL